MSIGAHDLITFRLDLEREFIRLIRAEVKKYSNPENAFEFGKGSGLLMSGKFLPLAFSKAVELKGEREKMIDLAKEVDNG